MHMSADETLTVRELSLPMHQTRGWLKFLAVLSILQGIFTAITLIGIVVAWLPIWIGVVLWQAADSAERAHVGGNRDALFHSLGKLKLYFIIQGVLALISLIFGIFAFSIMGLGAILDVLG